MFVYPFDHDEPALGVALAWFELPL